MYYKKPGLPEEDEIVICTVKKILYHSVFVTIEEYQNLEGMIHISEISPGRIRNLRDYVTEGKKIVCKVLNVKKDKHQVDLSLRRVNQSQRINKSKEFKQEQKAEKLLEFIGKEINKDLKEMYKFLGFKLIEDYGSLNNAFENFSLDEELVEKLKLPKKASEILLKTVTEKIKPPQVEVQAKLELKSLSSNGVEDIKYVLLKLQKGNIKITYVSAPKYKISIIASDYKTAEGILSQLEEDSKELAKEKNLTVNFERTK